MAFSHVLVTEAELNAMAGELVDGTGWVEANKQAWANQAGAYLCVLCKYDLVTNSATLTSNAKEILAEYIARAAAINGILYNVNGYSTESNAIARLAAETMVQYHAWRMNIIERLIKQEGFIDYIK